MVIVHMGNAHDVDNSTNCFYLQTHCFARWAHGDYDYDYASVSLATTLVFCFIPSFLSPPIFWRPDFLWRYQSKPTDDKSNQCPWWYDTVYYVHVAEASIRGVQKGHQKHKHGRIPNKLWRRFLPQINRRRISRNTLLHFHVHQDCYILVSVYK